MTARQRRLTLGEIADQINAHLQRLEANAECGKHWDEAGASYEGGRYMLVRYVRLHGEASLTKDEALAYLEWLEAGNEGRHYEQRRGAR